MKLQRISIVVWKANHDECLQMNFKCCKLDVAHVFCFSSNLAKFKQTTKIAACRYGAQCCDGCQNQQLATWLHSTPSKQQLLVEWLGAAAI
jgi:hypothetical protein